jgi:hypothetical protein
MYATACTSKLFALAIMKGAHAMLTLVINDCPGML